jgi:hypothetical protein
MTANLAQISQEAWKTAADRLNSIGVFADEERKFPSVSMLRREVPQFEGALRKNGYGGGTLAIEETDTPRDDVQFLVFDTAKISDQESAEAAWHQDYRDRWHKRVSDRVENWISRLENLKETMQDWLPNGMSIVDRPPTRMYEGLMREFNVPPAQMPTFEVLRGTQKVMRVQPKGLWIIGANGRVDLITGKGSLILVDNSEFPSSAPDWHYYAPEARTNSVQLDKARFIGLLN